MFRDGVVGFGIGEIVVATSYAALYGLLKYFTKVLGILKGTERFMLHVGDCKKAQQTFF